MRRRFGIVFQDPSLDGDMTACENMELHGVLLSRAAQDCGIERTEELLRLFELWDRRNEQVKTILGRHEAAARDRARPAAHAQDPVPRRADARASIRRPATSSGRT